MVPNITPEQLAQIDSQILSGNKIAAIKIYRSLVRCQLIDAKEFVEARAAELRKADPEKFSTQPAGCMSLIVIFALLTMGVATAPLLAKLF